MSNANEYIHPDIYEYILATTLREDELGRALRDETARLPESGMQIAPDQGQFMAMMVRLMGARAVLEVGVFTGYSSLCMARALPSEGHLVACDISVEYTDVARRFWKQAGVEEKVDLRIGPAMETLDALIDEGGAGSFDLAFVDADKENYPGYYEKCLVLVRSGGLIMFDNALWSGGVADSTDQSESTAILRDLNARFADDDRIGDVSLLVMGDGLMLVRKI